MEEVRAGMVASRRIAELRIHDRVHLHAARDRLLHPYAMCAHTLYWLHATEYIGKNRVVIIGTQPAVIANLAARVSVERRVIEHDVDLFARGSRRHARTVARDNKHLAVGRDQLRVAFESGLR